MSTIPDPVQVTVRDLAERMECFIEAADAGSWIQLQTWLLSMRPGFDTLLDIGLDGGVPRGARMTITPATQERIAQSFVVPDSLEGTD